MIAEENAEDHPSGCRSQHDRAHDRRVKIAGNFLERKKDGGERRIEGCGNGSGGSYGDQFFNLLGAQAEQSSEDRTDARANLHRRTFAAEGYSGGESCGGTEELTEHGAEGDAAFAREKSGLRLGHAAAAGVREIAIEKIADAERTDNWEEDAPPAGATDGIEPHPQVFGEQDEGDDGEPSQGADHEGENEKYLSFALPQLGDAATKTFSPADCDWRRGGFGHQLRDPSKIIPYWVTAPVIVSGRKMGERARRSCGRHAE